MFAAIQKECMTLSKKDFQQSDIIALAKGK